MKTSSKHPVVELTENQRTALITLLGDDDSAVYRTVREKLLSFGPKAAEWLRPYLLSSDPLLRRRSQEIVDFFARQEADTAFLAFCLKQGEEFDVEEGIWRLARTHYPGANMVAYAALLDSFAADLRQRITPKLDPEKIISIVNEHLFDKLGFAGNEENYYDPENSYLNRVLDRRTGNPISLCLIYIMIARRLKLPVAGIGLPGHFICRFQNSKDELYIDAFNRGKLLTKADCVKYLLHTNHNLDEGHLTPVSARRILLRICANLHQIYTQHKQEEEVSRFQRYLVALAK
jgi:regulator of sirC expression with transglutaminase-like and TPR domain